MEMINEELVGLSREEYIEELKSMSDWAVIIGEWKENAETKQWVEQHVGSLSSNEHYNFIRKTAELHQQLRKSKYQDESDIKAWEEFTSTVLTSKPNQIQNSKENKFQVQLHLTKLISNAQSNPAEWGTIKQWFDDSPQDFHLAVFPNFIGAVFRNIRENCPEFAEPFGVGVERWKNFKSKIMIANAQWFEQNQLK